MKTCYLLLLLSLSSLFINLQAQTFDWAQRGGWFAYDYGYGITLDNSGNIYVAGKYEMNADFSDTILPNQGNHDIFAAQYSPSGKLNWIRTGGGPSGDYAHAIACDKISNLYVAGEIEGYGTQIIFPGSSITLHCTGDNDAFIANYDLSGDLLWARSGGGYYDDKAQAVAYDDSGNVFMSGYFNDTASFGGITITGFTTGLNDMFVAKYDKSGKILWVRHAGGPGRDEAKGMKCDSLGNVYVCGLYSDGAVFGTQTLSSPGYYNTFLAKYSPDGVLVWVQSGGGDYDDVAWALTLDKKGLIYVAGEFNAYADFGGIHLTTMGMADAFVACYDGSGNVQWATGAGGKLIDRARGVGCDGTNIYITGQFGDSSGVAFGPFQLKAADSSDIFIAALNNKGNFIWATSVGGPPDSLELLGYESGNAICADASGNAYATGSTLQGGQFGNTFLPQYSRTDFFITEVSPQVTGIKVEAKNSGKQITIYPNPSNGQLVIDVNQLPEQKIETCIYNCRGQLVDIRVDQSPSKINLDLSAQSNGIYFIEIRTEDQQLFNKKIVLQQ